MTPFPDFSELNSLADKVVIITGVKGMLGSAFKDIIDRSGIPIKVYAFSKQDLDVTNREKVLDLFNLKPNIIIHCAAIVNADYCEDNEEETFNVKINGIKNIIELANLNYSKVIYPQSFLIFDGVENPINENTVPNPLSIYGKLKLMSEELLLKELPESLVIRMAGFFGGYEIDKNFVGKILPHISKLISNGQNSIQIGDRVWQPTFTNDLAFNSLLLAAKNKKGIYSMASHGKASFFELTCVMAETINIKDKFTITEIKASSLKINEKAKRPDIAIIENKRLKEEGLDRQRTWRESITEYLNHPYFKNLFK